jgi:lipopolysaccharide heptosyltransferase II
VDWYLEVLRRLSVPVNWDFEWLPPRPSVAKELERKWNAAAAPWIAVQPGARWGTKRWPIGNYAALVAQLAEQFPAFRFLILGTAADRELGRTIQSAAPNRCLDLTGQTSLPEMVEWLRRSELLICNDSGPMHIAAALGRPLVALFGPTEPRRTGPYGQPAAALQVQLPCVPCFKDRCFHQPRLECLSSIRPADVLLAVRQRLNLPKAG